VLQTVAQKSFWILTKQLMMVWHWYQLDHIQITCSRQITLPAPHHSIFCRPDALPEAQPTAQKSLKEMQKNVKQVSKILVIYTVELCRTRLSCYRPNDVLSPVKPGLVQQI